jgi:hypothetical protein
MEIEDRQRFYSSPASNIENQTPDVGGYAIGVNQ